MTSIEDFKAAMRNFASGVTVVTSVDAAGTPVGATVSAFSSVSAEPPMILVCLNGRSRSSLAVHESQSFSVHILGQHHVELAKRFASDHSDKFPNGFVPGLTGAPALLECDIRLDCTVHSEVSAGTHNVVIGQVEHIAVTDIAPLVFANRTFCQPLELDALATS